MQVQSYRVQYNVKTNQGAIEIALFGGANGRLDVNSDIELVAVMLLLNKNPVDYDQATGALNVPWRPVGA